MSVIVNYINQFFFTLRIIDVPTLYIAGFNSCWVIILFIFSVFARKQKKVVFTILSFIPVINFAVFSISNYIKGALLEDLVRLGSFGGISLAFCVFSLIYANKERKKILKIFSGIIGVGVIAWSAFFLMCFCNHFCNFSHMSYSGSMAALIDELEKNYVLRDYKEIDFDALRQEYIPMAAEAEKNGDEVAFVAAVNNLCYEFHDIHISIGIPDVELQNKYSAAMSGMNYGFTMVRLDDGKVIAIHTYEESDAFKKGICDGCEITGWDGEEINEAISKVRCPASGAFCAMPFSENEDFFKPIYLSGIGGETVRVKFIDSYGNEKEVTVKNEGSNEMRLLHSLGPFMDIGMVDVSDEESEEFAETVMLDDHCGYLRITSEHFNEFTDYPADINDDYPQLRKYLISKIEKLRSQGMDRLIFDIRGNEGGYQVVSDEIISLFSKEELVTYKGFYNGQNFIKYTDQVYKTSGDGRYADIPVVILVNAGCASGGDIIAYRLSSCPNVTLMGITTTAGSAQTTGGECMLSNSIVKVYYPITASLDEEGKVLIDSGKDRTSSIKLDVKIPLDYETVYHLFYNDYENYSDYDGFIDYEAEYARRYLNKKQIIM